MGVLFYFFKFFFFTLLEFVVKTFIGFYLKVQMPPSTKVQGSKRPRSKGIPDFMIVDTIPKDLWQWWTGMGSYEKKE